MAIYECECQDCKHQWQCTGEEYEGACPKCGSTNITEEELEEEE